MAVRFNEGVGSAIPETDTVAGNFTILDDSGLLFHGLALDRWAAAGFALLRWEAERSGIEAQAGYGTNMAATAARNSMAAKVLSATRTL
jgi:hypothetical protein